MTERPAGPILDELAVTFLLSDSDRVTEVLVLAKTMDMETEDVALAISSNKLDWIAKAGLVAAAQQVFYGDTPEMTDSSDE